MKKNSLLARNDFAMKTEKSSNFSVSSFFPIESHFLLPLECVKIIKRQRERPQQGLVFCHPSLRNLEEKTYKRDDLGSISPTFYAQLLRM